MMKYGTHSAIYIVIAFFIGFFIGRGSTSPVSIPAPILSADTVTVQRFIADTIIEPRFRTVRISDTLRLVDIDTLWVEAKTFWNADSADELIGEYIAYFDTALVSGIDTLGYTEVEFRSPMPIHQRSYFSLRQSVADRIITVVKEREGNFFDRLGIGVFAGIGNRGEAVYGAGITLKLF